LQVLKNALHKELTNLKNSGKKIIGFGASHSTTTLLYHFELSKFIDYIVDDNPSKHNLFSPGYHIPVYSTKKLYDDNPDYVLLLAWQHANTIMERHNKYRENGGSWIIPLPSLQKQ
jgi:hypothetical protein